MSAVIANQTVDPGPKPILTVNSPNFTSANLRVSLDEFSANANDPKTNRGFQFSFMVDIFKDGVFHHTLSVTQVSRAESIPGIIRDRLTSWNAAYAADLGAISGDIDLTQDAPEADARALASALDGYRAQRAKLALGIIQNDDAALAASLQAVKDAYAVNPDRLTTLFRSFPI